MLNWGESAAAFKKCDQPAESVGWRRGSGEAARALQSKPSRQVCVALSPVPEAGVRPRVWLAGSGRLLAGGGRGPGGSPGGGGSVVR